MNCQNCGAAQPEWARFCTRCGVQLAAAGPAPAGPPPPEPAPPEVTVYGPPPPGAAGYGPPPPGAQPPDIISYGPSSAEQPPPGGPAYGPPPPPYRAPRRRHGAALAAAAAVVVVGGLAVAGWQEHWPPAVFGHGAPPPMAWSPAEAPLPADAVQSGDQFAGLNDVACPTVDRCVTVGFYAANGSGQNTNGSTQGLLETLSRGAWAPATAPVDAAASQSALVDIDGVACSAQSACVAVGGYYDSKNVERPLTETLSGGSWTALTPGLPGDADSGKSAFLSEVACPAPGTCVATGWYSAQDGSYQPLIDTLSGGTWRPARAPLPGDASPGKSSSNLPTALFAVRCPAAGACVATGEYTDHQGHTQGLIDMQSGGTWRPARAPLPGDVTTADPSAYLWGIACPAEGTCIASGHYTGRNGRSQGLIETLSGGAWTAEAAPLPADAAASQKWTQDQPTGLVVAACSADGTCVTGGSYTARNGAVEAVIDTRSGGTWKAARAALPAGAAAAKQYAFFYSATCPAAGHCLAVGGYKTADGGTHALIETASYKRG